MIASLSSPFATLSFDRWYAYLFSPAQLLFMFLFVALIEFWWSSHPDLLPIIFGNLFISKGFKFLNSLSSRSHLRVYYVNYSFCLSQKTGSTLLRGLALRSLDKIYCSLSKLVYSRFQFEAELALNLTHSNLKMEVFMKDCLLTHLV